MRGKGTEILIYKNQFPYKAVKNVVQASSLTKVPTSTIHWMLKKELKTRAEIEDGGHTTPDGWGFDYLFTLDRTIQ